MAWVAVGAAVVGVAGSAYAQRKGAKAAQQAGQMGADAANQANATERYIYDQTRRDNEPFRQNALTAQAEYMQLLGLSPYSGQGTGGYTDNSLVTEGMSGIPQANQALYGSDPAYRKAWDDAVNLHRQQWNGDGYWSGSDRGWIEGQVRSRLPQNWGKPQPGSTGATPAKTPQQLQQEAFAKFRNIPSYQFGLTEGQRTIETGAAAKGGLFSGATAKALQKFGNDYADQQGFTPYMNRLASLSGMGQTASAQNQQAGQNFANSYGNNLQNAAASRASGLTGAANARAGMASDIAGIGGWLAGQWGRPQPTGVTPSTNFAMNFGNNTGWLNGGWGK